MANQAEFTIRLIDRITAPAKQASVALHGLERRLKAMNKSVKSWATDTAMPKLKDTLTLAGAAMAGVAAAIGVATIKMADFSQRSRVGFALLAQYGASGDAIFEHARDLAVRLGIDVESTTDQYKKFLALQFNPKQADTLIKMGADMRALGASTEETHRIFLQLGQIAAKGKLQGEELIVLAENGLSTKLVYENLAKASGKSMDQIRKDISAGAVDSSMALNAIGATILQKTGQSEFGKAGETIAHSTLSGLFGLFKAKGQQTMQKAVEGIMPKIVDTGDSVFAALTAGLEGKQGQATLAALQSGIGEAAEAIKAALPHVQEFVSAFIEGFGEAWKFIGPAVSDFFGMFSASGPGATNQVKVIAKALGQIVVVLGALVIMLGGAFLAAIAGVTALFNILKAFWTAVMNGLGQLINCFVEFFANIEAKINAGHVVNAVKDVAGQAVGAAKSALGIASPSRVFATIGENVVAGFSEGIDGASLHATLPMPAVPSLDGGAMAAAGGAGVTFSAGAIQITVTGARDARETAREVQRVLASELAAALEGMAIGAGA